MCVGQLVARLEGEVMMAALARKVGSIEITGPAKRLYNNTLRGLEVAGAIDDMTHLNDFRSRRCRRPRRSNEIEQ